MFLNPASSSSIFNENTITSSQSSSSFHRSSSSKNENSVRPLGMKTPHNTVKHDSSLVKKSGQQQQSTQRRRRALGDISNKNGGGSAAKGSGKNGSSGTGIGGGSLALKPLSLNNNQGGLRSNKPKNRQVKFSKSGIGIKSVSKPSLSSSSSSTKLQQKKQSSSSEEYDGIFGVTTRWSTTHQDHDRPSPLEQLPDKDEFDLSTNVAEEIRQHRMKERVRKEKVEEERMEERLRMKRDVLFDHDDETKNDDVEDGLQQLLTNHCNIVEDDEQEALWELKTSPAWEEEEFDPAKERRLSGNDPASLWGDILSP